MSVRAYIIREKSIILNEEKYVHKNEEFCFNLWHQSDFLDTILKYGAIDYTNDNWGGEIEFSKEDFYNMIKKENFTNEKGDLDSINLIKKFFEENNNSEYIVFNCY